MADEKPLLQDALAVQLIRPHLAEHLFDGGFGRLGIILGGGVAFGQVRLPIFEVRHIDLHQPLQHMQTLHTVIAGAVPHHRDAQVKAAEGLGDPGGIVGAGDQIQGGHALIPQAEKQLPQLRHRQRAACLPPADLPVLAENAAEIAAGEEHGPGPPAAADAGLLPEMSGRPGHPGQGRGEAHSAAAFPPDSPAGAGADIAFFFHGNSTFRSGIDNKMTYAK